MLSVYIRPVLLPAIGSFPPITTGEIDKVFKARREENIGLSSRTLWRDFHRPPKLHAGGTSV